MVAHLGGGAGEVGATGGSTNEEEEGRGRGEAQSTAAASLIAVGGGIAGVIFSGFFFSSKAGFYGI